MAGGKPASASWGRSWGLIGDWGQACVLTYLGKCKHLIRSYQSPSELPFIIHSAPCHHTLIITITIATTRKSFCSCLANPLRLPPPRPRHMLARRCCDFWLTLISASCIVRMANVIPDPRREHDPSPVMPTLTSTRRLIAMSLESDRFPFTSSSTSH